MQDAGRSDIDLVLTGAVSLAAASSRACWIKVLPEHAAKFPDAARQLPARRAQRCRSSRKARRSSSRSCRPVRCSSTTPTRSSSCRRRRRSCSRGARPIRTGSIYARPANSGPGLTFLMGLPYLLGDKNPKDPVNGWDKTWAFLKELEQLHRVLPDGHRRDDEGARRRLARHDGDDDGMGPESAHSRHRARRTFKVTPFKGMTWVNDAHYMVDPEGRAAGEAGRRARPDGVPAEARGAGATRTTRVISIPARR